MEIITDIYQKVTDEIIAAVEEGCIPWIRPWRDGEPVFPINAALNRAYNGINIPLLWHSANRNGYEHDRWLTYRQALNAGGYVRMGEKSTLAVLYLPQERTDKDENGNPIIDKNGQPKIKHFALLREFRLFNIAQCEGLPLSYMQPVIQVSAPVESADAIISHSGVPVIHRRQQRAYYYPLRDVIIMPHPEQFNEVTDYYGTLLHEITHASGHVSRLAREGITSTSKTFGDPVYAFEELIVRRRGVNTGVDMIILDSWENPCEPDLPVSVMNRLKSRKGNGTIACQEKAQTAEAIVGRAGHRKMRMVKAKLPEPQSSEFYPQQRRSGGCNVVPCRYRDAMRPGLKKMVRLNIFGPACTVCPLSGGSKGRTGHLSASYLHIRVTTGSPKWARVLRPTWRQSCHISQMPEVMLRTAISGWMIGNERFRVTGPGVSADQVKGSSVCDSGLPTEGMC
ncbi:antirestriction protein ArdC [Erwinia toletana]|uniref:Antirestriction protein ArdC n=1 Tax=Winslowiella toletana TaxID=92490 RepID=A0ABS4PDJ6_9GAMM|nr:ArdC-like ssDNA-binding domain-containing protein [Winslowiella toletana]MBP2170703.1 antirestriction protein ArdC [Winslowiella toletana]